MFRQFILIVEFIIETTLGGIHLLLCSVAQVCLRGSLGRLDWDLCVQEFGGVVDQGDLVGEVVVAGRFAVGIFFLAT